MTDILDKAILIGLGLEKRVKDALNELVSEGKEAKTGEGGELPPKQELENKLVDEGKEKVDKEIEEAVKHLLEKFKVATKDDMEIIEKMAQVAREKVDKLEKRIEELEKKAVNRDRKP